MKNLRKYYVLVMIPSLFLLFGGYLFWDFVHHAIQINPFLNGFIISVALLGIVLIVYSMLRVNWEYEKLNLFYERVNGGESMEDLVKIEEFQSSEIAKVLISIANTKGRLTSRIEQEVIEGSIAELQSHLVQKAEFPNFLGGFLIALGLLGTFIGLLETLVGTAALIDGFGQASQGADMDASFIKLVSDLKKPLESMGTAFSASMFGLIGSLTVGLSLMPLRTAAKQVVTRARECIKDMVLHVREDIQVVSTFKQGVSESFLTEFLEDLMVLQRESIMASRASSEASLQASIGFEGLNERLDSVIRLVSENVDESQNLRRLVSFGPRMHEIFQQTLAEIRYGNEIVERKVFEAKDLKDSISLLEKRLSLSDDTAMRSSDLLQKILFTIEGNHYSFASALTLMQAQQSEIINLSEKSIQSVIQLPILLENIHMRMGDELQVLQQKNDLQSELIARFDELAKGIAENSNNISRDALSAQKLLIDLARYVAMINDQVKNVGAVPTALTSIIEVLKYQNINTQSITDEIRLVRQTIVKDLRMELRETIRELWLVNKEVAT